MISKDKFEELIQMAQDYESKFNKYIDILNFDNDIFEFPWKLWDKLMSTYFSETGEDWISYYIWELPMMGEGPHAWDKNEKEIPLNDIDDLWELVKEYRI